MKQLIAAIEIDRTKEPTVEEIDRLSRQLRDANNRIARAFDQGAAMVIRAVRTGIDIEEIAKKVRWDLIDGPAKARAVTREFDAPAPIPMELEDSDEHTEPMTSIPLAP